MYFNRKKIMIFIIFTLLIFPIIVNYKNQIFKDNTLDTINTKADAPISINGN